MDERQIILRLLVPAHQQAARAVGPTMGALHDPATCSPAAMQELLFVASPAHVFLVAAAANNLEHGLAGVTLIETKMLRAPASRTRSANRNAAECGGEKFLIVNIGTGDCHRDRHSAAVGEHRSFDAELTAIGRIFAGFFPRPAALWSLRRRHSATAKRFLCGDHTRADTLSRVAETRHWKSTLESSDALCSKHRSTAAVPSTGSPCGARRRCHRQCAATRRAADHLCCYSDKWAAMAVAAAITSLECASASQANHTTYQPPCPRKGNSFPCPTHRVVMCSVSG